MVKVNEETYHLTIGKWSVEVPTSWVKFCRYNLWWLGSPINLLTSVFHLITSSNKSWVKINHWWAESVNGTDGDYSFENGDFENIEVVRSTAKI